MWKPAVLLAALLFVPASALADGATRVVVIKADGLPHDVVQRAVLERNPRTGKSVLPWIEHVFYKGGTRMANFYVRGMSLSGPSWSMLDTGQHLQIRSNIEFDRYTRQPYDYLNFLPFWLGSAARRRVDMLGTSTLDDLRLPLLLDAYDYDERYQSFQLFQRGTRWMTLGDGLQNLVSSRSPRQLVDEWMLGIEMSGILAEQLERELIQKLGDPRIRYLDYYTADFDHVAHNNRDRPTHLASLRALDALVGRIWTAIERTPEADETVMVLLSDHGFNSDERTYSQGYSLVNLLSGASGGGHHVVTKRRPLTDYSIKGMYPLVPTATTPSSQSPYLKGQGDDYPTALVDVDGNERSAIHLRHSALNVLHILWKELRRPELPSNVRRAASQAFLSVVDRYRPEWQRTIVDMQPEVEALRRSTAALRARVAAAAEGEEAKKETDAAREETIRLAARVESWTREDVQYRAYLGTLERLLAVTADTLADPAVHEEDVIAVGAMGDRNTVFDLQNYVVGPSRTGLALAPDGSLDFDRSFARLDYFTLLGGIVVRNNVQAGVANAPVDFTVARVPCERIDGIGPEAVEAESCIWLRGGADAQALMLGRTDAAGQLRLRYVPVSGLVQDGDGTIRATSEPWRNGLPLKLWEDEGLELPDGADRRSWLDGWHSDLEWLRASHRAQYSNAMVGLHEQLAPHRPPALDVAQAGLSDDERLVLRFRLRQRALIEPDIIVLAADHWNFDVRGFNPGGNHGSFFRASTHATLMVAGGERTGVPRGLSVEQPYDGLSFMPTILALTGQLEADGRPSARLRERGFAAFPGPVIRELLGLAPEPASRPVSPTHPHRDHRPDGDGSESAHRTP